MAYAARRHRIRKCILVERKQMGEEDFMAPFFIEQVLVLHDCIRVYTYKCYSNVCRVEAACGDHDLTTRS